MTVVAPGLMAGRRSARNARLVLRLAICCFAVIAISSPAAARADDAAVVDEYRIQLQQRFEPRVAMAEDLRILLRGPSSAVYKSYANAARVGEGIYSGGDAYAYAWALLAASILEYTGDYLLGAGLALSSRAAAYFGPIGLAGAVLGIVLDTRRVIKLTYEDDDLLNKAKTAFLARLRRELLVYYVRERLGGSGPETAYSDMEDLVDPATVSALADALGVSADALPAVLEQYFGIIRLSEDPESKYAVGAELDQAASFLQLYRKSVDGLIHVLPQGADQHKIVNEGPADVILTYKDADGRSLGEVRVPANDTATVTVAGGWTAATNVDVYVNELGTFNVPSNSYIENIWHDDIAADYLANGVVDFEIDRVFARSAGTTHPVAIAWNFGDGHTTTTNAPGTVRHTYACPGPRTVRVDIAAGPFTSTAIYAAKVPDPWNTTISADRSGVVLPGSPLTLQAEGALPQAGVAYSWNFGDGTTGQGKTVTKVFTQEGPRTVALTATETATGCSRHVTRSVSVGTVYSELPGLITGDVELEPYSVYLVSYAGLEIKSGARLTLGEGTIVKVRNDELIQVAANAELVVKGSAAHPAHITSFDDDSVGGDSNANGPTAPSSHSWDGINMYGTLTARHVTIAGASGGSSSSTGAVRVYSGLAVIEDAHVSRGLGVLASSPGRIDMARVQIDTTDAPVKLGSAGNRLRDIVITGTNGIDSGYSGQQIIDGLTATNSLYPVTMRDFTSGAVLRRINAPRGAALSVGLSESGIRVGSAVTWTNTDLPYIFRFTGDFLFPGALLVSGRLTMVAGVSFISDQRGISVAAGGALDLIGTAENPVTLSGTPSPASGTHARWRGISSSGTVTAEHVDIADASSTQSPNPAVRSSGGTVDMRDSRIAAAGGVHSSDTGKVTLERVRIEADGNIPPVTLSSPGNRLTDIVSTGLAGVSIMSSSDQAIDGLDAPNSTTPVSMEDHVSGATLRRVTAAPGAAYNIGLTSAGIRAGTVVEWANTDMPYRIPFSGNSLSVYAMTVTGRLTLRPGVRFLSDQRGFQVGASGALELLGSAEHPVTLAATSPTTRSWQGITSTGTMTAEHAHIADAIIPQAPSPAVQASGGTVELRDTRITAGGGLQSSGTGRATLERVRIEAGTLTPIALSSPGNRLTDIVSTGSTGLSLTSSADQVVDGLDAPHSTAPVNMDDYMSGVTLRRIAAAPGAAYRVGLTSAGIRVGTVVAWTSKDLPYSFTGTSSQSLLVVKGRLDVSPGVRVLARSANSGITVEAGAQLNLAGSAEAPVSVDGVAPLALWSGITVAGNLTASHATINGATGGSPASAIRVGGRAELTDSTITGSAGIGSSPGGMLDLERVRIDAGANNFAVTLQSAGNRLKDITVLSAHGVHIPTALGAQTIDGLAAPVSTDPVLMNDYASMATLRRITAAAGATIQVSLTSAGVRAGYDIDWDATDLPYRIIPNSNASYLNVAGRLTAGPGVRILADQTAGISVASGGTLSLEGTAEQIVRLDRSGSAPTWRGIGVNSGGRLEAVWAIFDGAVEHSIGGTALIRLSRILDRLVAGAGHTIDATDNWWGASNGPAPAGAGSTIVGTVTHNPWCVEPDCNDRDPLAITDIALDRAEVTLSTHESATLVANATRRDGTVEQATDDVDWTSSDASVATVSPTGDVTAIAAGTAAITARARTVFATVSVTVRSLDVIAPTVTVTNPAASARYSRGSLLVADYECIDNEGGTGVDTCDGTFAPGAPIPTHDLGVRGFTVTATDHAGNTATTTVTFEVIDDTDPTVVIDAPMDGADIPRGSELRARYACSDETNGSGLRSCVGTAADGELIDTSTPGARIFAVIATDESGNSHTTAVTYAIVEPLIAQSIVFTSQVPQYAIVGEIYGATATGGESGNPVLFSADLTSGWGVCAVTGDGNVSFSGVGSCVIAANQHGNESYAAAATQTQTIAVAPALKSIAVSPLRRVVPKGASVQYTATATYTDGSKANVTDSVSWSSSNGDVALITSGGQATAVASDGVSDISAAVGSHTGSTTLTAASAALTSITISPATPNVPKATSQQLMATGAYTDGTTVDLTTTVVWSTSNPDVATVSSGGLATAVAATGSAAIKATSGTRTGSTTLHARPPTLTSIAISPADPIVAHGASVQLTAIGTYTDASTKDITRSVTWSSSDTAVATIAATGLAKATASAGTSTITASSSATTATAALTTTTAALKSIAVSPLRRVVPKGASVQYTATATYTDGSKANVTDSVSWSSSNGDVALITSGGQATAVASDGVSDISAAVGSHTGSTTLTAASAALTSITISPATPNVPKATSQQLMATGAYTDGTTVDLTTTVVWSTSNPDVATVSSGGLATAVAATGSAAIKATSGTRTGSTTLHARPPTLTSIAISPADPIVAHGASVQLTAIGTYTDASTKDITRSVTWSSSDTAVATIAATGLAKATASAGTSTITASSSATTATTSLVAAGGLF